LLLGKGQGFKESEIPVELSAIEVPPQQRGREMISLDITEYGISLTPVLSGCRSAVS
jgi:hypothetical protein